MKKIICAAILLSTLWMNSVQAAKLVSGVLNINKATKQELIMLPGIGEAKAEAILKVRAQKPFTRVEDVLAVQGIGEKLLAKIAPHIVVSGETNLKEGVPSAKQ